MKVRVLRSFWYGGAIKAKGEELELPDSLGREVVFGGKAELVKPAKPPEPPKPAEAPKPDTKQPMTTRSAPALAGKKGD